MLRRITAGLLVTIAIVSFLAAFVASRPRETDVSFGKLSPMPVLSARRTPHALRMAVAREKLGAVVEATLAVPALASAKNTICAAIEADGALVVNNNPTVGLLPASTMKTLTAVSAIATLDPTMKFRTEVRSTAKVVNGRIAGDVWLVGGGDPLLETIEYTNSQPHDPESATSFDKLVDAIVASGVKFIDGAIVGDDRRFDDVRVRPTWKKNYVGDGEVGPIGGLMVDDNFTIFDAKKRRKAAQNVAADAAQTLRTRLEAKGVVISKDSIGALKDQSPADKVAPNLLASVESLPLADIIREMLSWSDNTTAEMLVKEIGRAKTGKGTWEDGLATIKTTLDSLGVDTKPLVMIDGSGLDRANQVTCGLLLDVVRSQPIDGPFHNALAVMGKYGTLRKRLKGSPAEGKVFAKTGSLNGVSSLAGEAQSAEARPILFALVFNGLASTGDGVIAGNSIAEALTAFPDAPPLASFEPTPP